jgi:hypothetical protein
MKEEKECDLADYSAQKTAYQHILPMFNLVLGFIVLSVFSFCNTTTSDLCSGNRGFA